MNNKCRLCHKGFNSKQGLNVHITKMHRIPYEYWDIIHKKEGKDIDIFYEKRQYAYKKIYSILLDQDLEILANNILIIHKSHTCFGYGHIADIRVNFERLRPIILNFDLTKPYFCLDLNIIHEISHLLEIIERGESYDLPFHSERFYRIGNSIEPNFEVKEKSMCKFCFFLLRMNLYYKSLEKMKVIKN